ncbi:TetR/AcrR family transcriptional regulator [Reyranella sp.]|uniref:TetR/AcrR family transcriptional regulator n=1 Tax=Reyranella sp. TaxID=1929291 RepID=UPI003D0E4011
MVVRTDGRNRRAAETRRKIIEAAKIMIAETSVAPTVVGVARRADVSVRSVFQHFHDVESLFVTVMDSIRADVVVPEMPSANRPLSTRIESIVAAFAELFDKVVPLRVASGQFVDHPALLERSQTARNELREATFEVFAPEFASLTEQAREELADAIGAALSLDAWIVLRRRDGLSLERATAVWRLTLTALLAQAVGAAKG